MPTPRHSPGRGLVVIVAVALGVVTAMLSVTVANVALVAIKDDPGPALRAIMWIGDAYMAELRLTASQWVRCFRDP